MKVELSGRPHNHVLEIQPEEVVFTNVRLYQVTQSPKPNTHRFQLIHHTTQQLLLFIRLLTTYDQDNV